MFQIVLSFLQCQEIVAYSRETFACFMMQDNHTQKLIYSIYGTTNFPIDMSFFIFQRGGTGPPDNRKSMLNCRFCVLMQPRIFFTQNGEKSRDKLPYRVLSCLKWPLYFCGLEEGLLLCLSGTTIIRGSKFRLFMGHEISLFFWVFEVFHRWGPGPLNNR